MAARALPKPWLGPSPLGALVPAVAGARRGRRWSREWRSSSTWSWDRRRPPPLRHRTPPSTAAAQSRPRSPSASSASDQRYSEAVAPGGRGRTRRCGPTPARRPGVVGRWAVLLEEPVAGPGVQVEVHVLAEQAQVGLHLDPLVVADELVVLGEVAQEGGTGRLEVDVLRAVEDAWWRPRSRAPGWPATSPTTPPIEKPSTPMGASVVRGMSRSVAAVDRTRSAVRFGSVEASSASASSGVSAVRPSPWRSGAMAAKPASASRSHTPLKNGVRPHQPCSTSTPGAGWWSVGPTT